LRFFARFWIASKISGNKLVEVFQGIKNIYGAEMIKN